MKTYIRIILLSVVVVFTMLTARHALTAFEQALDTKQQQVLSALSELP